MFDISIFDGQPFTFAQAVSGGISPRELSTAVRNRVVRRLFRGVYIGWDVADTLPLRARAALLVLSPHAVACDRTAAWLHGVELLGYRELEIAPPLESYVLRWKEPTRRCDFAGGTRDLSPCDITDVGGVRVTTPLRTALDLGCKLSRRDGLHALDAFMRQHGVTREEMERLLPRYRRRRGVVQLRQLIPMADPRSESSAESWTRLEIIDHGIPWPEPQCWVYVDGVPTYRLDLAWPKHKVSVEYDGVEFHSSEEQREHDRRRREWLREHGWIVIVLTKDSFSADAVDRWVQELRSALRLRT